MDWAVGRNEFLPAMVTPGWRLVHSNPASEARLPPPRKTGTQPPTEDTTNKRINERPVSNPVDGDRGPRLCDERSLTLWHLDVNKFPLRFGCDFQDASLHLNIRRFVRCRPAALRRRSGRAILSDRICAERVATSENLRELGAATRDVGGTADGLEAEATRHWQP